MARLELHDNQLVLALSTLEHGEALHGDLRASLAAVRDIRAVPDAWPEIHGLRAPGTGVPGVVMVGTLRDHGSKDFAAVHGTGPAVVVELEGTEFRRWILTDDDAAQAVVELRLGVGLA